MFNLSGKNFLNYLPYPKSFPVSAKWGIRFILKADDDCALNVLNFCNRFSVLSQKEIFYRRLVIHEAVLNALYYGGPCPVLSAWGYANFMQIEIEQQNKIQWRQKKDKYRGTALMKRYVKNMKIYPDGKKLVLQFY